MTRKLLSFLLAVCMLLALLPAFAESYTHTATATIQLKLRRAPAKNSTSFGSVAKGETVYITDYGEEWCEIQSGERLAYVMTKYLDNITPVEDAQQEGEEENIEEDETEIEATENPSEEPAPVQPLTTAKPVQKTEVSDETAAELGLSAKQLTGTAYVDSFTMTEENFEARLKAKTIVNGSILEEPNESAASVYKVSKYKFLDVGEICGEWCFVHYSEKGANKYGYLMLDQLFEWDRYDAYAGDIPNLDIWTNMIWINNYVSLTDYQTGKEIGKVNADNGDTIMPGSAIAAGEKDEQGRYLIPIERTYAYINEEDVGYVMPVKDWRTAKSGDLISVMTTFFVIGTHTMEFRGRNWNIRLATCMANNTVLQPGQHYDQNSTIGPYTGPTGYKKAPTTTGSGYGGGTCQVNSTFYITTVSIPLLVYQRQVHQDVGMHYCKIGLDSSVGNSDSNTLKMMNSLPYAVRYEFFISDGVLTCAIFRQ